ASLSRGTAWATAGTNARPTASGRASGTGLRKRRASPAKWWRWPLPTRSLIRPKPLTGAASFLPNALNSWRHGLSTPARYQLWIAREPLEAAGTLSPWTTNTLMTRPVATYRDRQRHGL